MPLHGNETVTKIEKYYLCYLLFINLLLFIWQPKGGIVLLLKKQQVK